MKDKIRKTIRLYDMIGPGEPVVVGISGGPDSVCLLSVLSRLGREEGFGPVIGAHVNHMLRGEEADADTEYVKRLCEASGVPLFVKHADVKAIASGRGCSEEVAGREARYDFFEEVCRDQGARLIAVAHNKNDRAETVMMNIIRGTGIKGLRGIPYVRPLYDPSVPQDVKVRRAEDIRIIRPLLDTTREEIESYCRAEGLDPRTDKTNLVPVYTRNKLRLELLPYISENFNENIIDTLCRLASSAAESDEIISDAAERFITSGWRGGDAPAEYEGRVYKGNDQCGSLPARALRELSPAMQKNVITASFRRVGLLRDIGAVHLTAASRVLAGGRGNKEVEFPNGYVMYVKGARVWFLRKLNMTL